MGTSVTLGWGVVGKKAAEEAARQITDGAGGGAIQLGKGILGPDAVYEEEAEPEKPARIGLTLSQVKQLIEKDPNNYEMILKMESELETPRITVARELLKLDNEKLKKPMPPFVLHALRNIAKVKE